MSKTWKLLHDQPRFWQRYFVREQLIEAVRQYFTNRQFHEVEVPLLAPTLPTESYYEVFETELLNRHRRGVKAYLATSPEPFLKKLLVAGIGNCYTITKSFRNTEDMSFTHNPEFTILEWYEVDTDYQDVMKTTEMLFCFIYKFLYSSSDERVRGVKKLPIDCSRSRLGRDTNNRLLLNYQGQSINITPPWERISMVEAFSKYARIELMSCLELKSMQKVAKVKGYQVEKDNTWEELFHQIYLNEVEPHFGNGKPTFIYDFPSPMAALAKKKDSDPRFAERFEFYIAGLELGDCYSELTDWKEQEERFIKETEERKRLGKINYPYDHDLIEAMKVGLPKCSGLAMGVDRVTMLFANAPRIQDVLLFPASEMWDT